MFIINEAIAQHAQGINSIGVNQRFYRTRNRYNPSDFARAEAHDIPKDTPYWAEIIVRAFNKGSDAIKRSLAPAILVWGLMAAIAAVYYGIPASHAFFIKLDALRASLGIMFPFLGMGLSVGVLAETMKVLFSPERRWKKENTITAGFNLFMFGVLGVTQSFFYDAQTWLIGSGNTPRILLAKMLIDQFIWTVFFANPYQTLLFTWKEKGFNTRQVMSELRPFKVFWGLQVLPVLITNWAFWIPMVLIIYSFPTTLQLPLVILAVTIWVLLLTILTQSKETK
ncbi:hypothetical protein [Cerasicoccus frondis]|uniref:hypothetical protein n=1 Tax=Cerasicoccus frondis TaxID=490090 RepID=UPI002852C0AD|nr:hypothetical protein [Cerasicoccus frondis]